MIANWEERNYGNQNSRSHSRRKSRLLQNARKNFEYAEDGMIDYYIYQIKANQSKLDYLIKVAKKKGVILSRDKEVKIRMILQKKLVG